MTNPVKSWWTDTDSNRELLGASQAFSHCYYQPMKFWSVIKDLNFDPLIPDQERYQITLMTDEKLVS